jgi:diaminopropionate ammonia-lyase
VRIGKSRSRPSQSPACPPRPWEDIPASAKLGEATAIPGDLDTLMARLACDEPGLIAGQELDRAATAFLVVPDEAAVASMRLLADRGIAFGESGVAGLAGFLQAVADPVARETFGLDGQCTVTAVQHRACHRSDPV